MNMFADLRNVAGKFSIETRAVDLASVVEAAVEAAQPTAAEAEQKAGDKRAVEMPTARAGLMCR